jgi:hypothetical protein
MRLVTHVLIRTLALCLLLGSGIGVAATTSGSVQRASDKLVQKLIDATGRDINAFGKTLSSDFKNSVIRGPKGEVNVAHYMDDLDDDIKKLKQRFTRDYSASAEAYAVLTRATPLNKYMQAHPELKGANDWDVVARDLNELAGAYGASFPLAPDASVRRISDGEIDAAAKTIAANIDKLKQALKSDLGKAKDLKEPGNAALANLDELSKALKDLRSLLDNDKPATAAARLVVQRTVAIGSFVDANAAALPKTVPLWQAGAPGRAKIAQAFGLEETPAATTQAP